MALNQYNTHPVVVTLRKHCLGFVLMISLCQAEYTAGQRQQHWCFSDYQPANMSTPPVWIPGSTQKSRAWAVRSRDNSHRLPVWLVKADVEGSSPVREDRLLRDEAVVASLSTPLVGQIHGALVWPVGLVVMVRHGGMGGGSAEGREQKSMISWASQSVREVCGNSDN